MNTQPLVSIIIPTYNRAHLFGETLDSIVAQTYLNWECIIVDDGSSDNTDEVIGKYVKKDSRFKYYHRPEEHLPGGNGARNYGFKMSRGDFIQWFDSDDLMVADKLELKVKAMLDNEVDFVVSKWKYFNPPKGVKSYDSKFSAKDVNFESFTTTYISWLTNDFMVKNTIAEKLCYNENLKSGQEYNYIAKMLLVTNNLYVLDKVLVNRSYSEDSIGVKRRKKKEVYLITTFDNSWITFKEIYPLSNYNKKFGQKLLLNSIRAYLEVKEIKKPSYFFMEIIKFYKARSIYFLLALISSRVLKKYNFFYKQLKYS
jgi:glycosyltransferase involved in cell wall biosynthesis